MTSASDSQKATTGLALAPMAAQAAPNKNEKTTISSTSPRAMASTMLAGNTPALLGRKKLYAHVFEGYWEDIGTVKAFFEANLALAQPLPPFNFFDGSMPVY